MITKSLSLPHLPPAPRLPIAPLAAWLRSLPAAVMRARERAAARRELALFDDRALRDIGISRYDIPWLLRDGPAGPYGR